MKDKNDEQTPDMFGERRPVGRPRVHASNAERQRAYRQRLKKQGKIERKRIMSAPIPEPKPLKSDVLDVTSSVQKALKDRR